MDTKKITTMTIEGYIKTFPKEKQEILQSVRGIIQKAVPEATEAISYGMHTFKLNGKNLVHFAAWKEHIGFYPTPSGTEEFKKELSEYVVSKGAIQFPFSKPMPLELIARISQYRAAVILNKD